MSVSVAEFAQSALQKNLAPRTIGSVETRIRHAARKLGWSFSRTKDVWYADPRISISGEQLARIEEVTGLRYGKQELAELDELIETADAFLKGNPHLDRSLYHAARAFLGALASARIER